MKKPSLKEVIVGIGIVLLVGYMFFPPRSHSGPSPVKRAQVEIVMMQNALTDYQSIYGHYPDGNRALILKGLSGDNPQRIPFIVVNHHFVNERGEYVDPWKTPYNITLLTNGLIIASAGKDRRFKTSDDIIFNSLSNNFVRP